MCHQIREESAPRYATWLRSERRKHEQQHKPLVKKALDEQASLPPAQALTVLVATTRKLMLASRIRLAALRSIMIRTLRCDRRSGEATEQDLQLTKKFIIAIDQALVLADAAIDKVSRRA